MESRTQTRIDFELNSKQNKATRTTTTSTNSCSSSENNKTNMQEQQQWQRQSSQSDVRPPVMGKENVVSEAPQDENVEQPEAMEVEVDMEDESKYDEPVEAEAAQTSPEDAPWVYASEVFPEDEAAPSYEYPQSQIAVVRSDLAQELADRLGSDRRVVVVDDGLAAMQAVRHLSAPELVLVKSVDSRATAEAMSRTAPTVMLQFEGSGAREVGPTSDVEAFFASSGMHRQCLLREGATAADAALMAEVVLSNPSLEIISVA